MRRPLPRQIKVVVADDHPLVLRGMATLLAGQPGFSLVATCADGQAAIAAIEEWRPDLACVDLAMPGATGLDVIDFVRKKALPTRVILIAGVLTRENCSRARLGGAYGLVSKTSPAEDLLACIKKVAAGEKWFADVTVGADGAEQPAAATLAQLTDRERQIAQLVVEAKSNKEIAKRLKLTDGTVKVHLHNIYRKLGVSSRMALAARMTSS